MADATTTEGGVEKLKAQLAPYGLEAMAPRAWEYYQANPNMSEAEFMYWVRQQPEYKQRYPAMEALAKNGHAIDEATYIGLERQYKSAARAAGLPEGFYDDPSDFSNLIAGEVSISEYGVRLDEYTRITYELPPQVRLELGRQYGLTNGDITAFVIDPTKALPILQKQVRAAESGAAAIMAGYGNLTRSEAEQLGGFGLQFDRAVQGFGQLANAAELFNPLIGDQGETAITRDEQLTGAFGGNAAAQRRIEDRARKRAAEFAGGGSYQGGGFGSAST